MFQVTSPTAHPPGTSVHPGTCRSLAACELLHCDNLMPAVLRTFPVYPGGDENRGVFNVPPELTKAAVPGVDKTGLDVVIHTSDTHIRAAMARMPETAFSKWLD